MHTGLDHVAWLIQNYSEIFFAKHNTQQLPLHSDRACYFELYKFKPTNQNQNIASTVSANNNMLACIYVNGKTSWNKSDFHINEMSKCAFVCECVWLSVYMVSCDVCLY